MKHLVTFILCLLGASSVFAQNAKLVEIQSLVPAEKRINFEDNNIAIVAFHYYADTIQGRAGGLIFDSILINAVANGIKSGLEESPMFQGTNIPIYNLYSDTSMIAKPMTQSELANIHEYDSATTIIAVEFLNMTATNSFGKNKNKALSTNIDFTALIKGYNASSGNVENKYFVKDQVVLKAKYDNKGNYYAPPSALEASKITAEMIGVDFAKRISPNWETVERIVFCDFRDKSGNLKLADKHFFGREWTKAAEYWTSSLDDKTSSNTKAQVMYNLAFSCELLEKFDLALQWLENAKSLQSQIGRDIDEYIGVIKQRIEDKKVLDQLF